ncbi:hypothetical protein IAU59_001418 [Kwoniella sp. CBS 9459]
MISPPAPLESPELLYSSVTPPSLASVPSALSSTAQVPNPRTPSPIENKSFTAHSHAHAHRNGPHHQRSYSENSDFVRPLAAASNDPRLR